jgi:ABC-2 type transport system ATP-binding protein
MGPADILRLFSSYYGERGRDSEDVLREVGLADVASTPWRRLSGGEQQRLSLGMALVGRPEVAFLDEPTAGMDPSARQLLWGVIRRLRDEGTCILLTTHYLDEAEKLADRVVILDHGRVVADGTPVELMSATAVAEIRFGAPPALLPSDLSDLGARLGGEVTESTPGEYVAAVSASPRHVADLTAWLAERDLPLADLRAGRQTLEDVFLRLTASTASGDEAASSPSSSRRRGPRRQS